MKRRLDETMSEARLQRDKKKFFFLKGGLDVPPDQEDGLAPEQAQVREAKRSKTRSQPDQRRNEISAIQDRILQNAIKSDFRKQIEQSVKDLIRLGYSGDPLMIRALHGIAVTSIVALNWIAQKKPEELRPIARREFCWPALIGRKRFIKKTNDSLIKRVQLGEGDAFTTREWQLPAPSTQAAFDLFLTAQLFEEDWSLPGLTEKNKRTWFEIAWDQMLKEGIEPEKIPWLAPVGKSAIGKKSISRGMPEQTEGMKRDDVRAEIKRQVWKAFDKLVAGQVKKTR
jgi:hypothetical protein